MAYQVDAQGAATFLRETEDLLAGARAGHLYSEDPQVLPKGPFSYAVPTATARNLVVHAWHGFPNANTMLRVQTLIERSLE
jgi:hypothetical protein